MLQKTARNWLKLVKKGFYICGEMNVCSICRRFCAAQISIILLIIPRGIKQQPQGDKDPLSFNMLSSCQTA